MNELLWIDLASGEVTRGDLGDVANQSEVLFDCIENATNGQNHYTVKMQGDPNSGYDGSFTCTKGPAFGAGGKVNATLFQHPNAVLFKGNWYEGEVHYEWFAEIGRGKLPTPPSLPQGGVVRPGDDLPPGLRPLRPRTGKGPRGS